MRMWKAAPLALVVVLLITCCSGVRCPGVGYSQPVTVENRTSVSIKVDIRDVELDYTGTPDVKPYAKNRNPVVLPGEVIELWTVIDPERGFGIRLKYFVAVITESDTILWQRIFTWDELNDMNWTLIIEPQ